MADNILQDTGSDYASKRLPQIPNFYSAVEDKDTIVIEDNDGGGDGEQTTE